MRKEDTFAPEEIQIIVASDRDHEKVFAEIYIHGKFVALMSQENGLEKRVLEFPGEGLAQSQITREVSVETFRRALELAEQKLTGQ